MDKKTPNKRKSLANTNTTPTKVQKLQGTPVSQKKPKTPKSANKNQKKQLNGNQNTPKGKKKPKETEEDETELTNESDENETDNSIEQAESEDINGNSDDNSDAEDSNEADDDEADQKEAKVDRKYSVYFAGLLFTDTETDVKNLFDDTNISSVVFLRNPATKKSYGSGFVNFKDEASVKKALQKNGSELNGRTLKVNLPVAKAKRTPASPDTYQKKKAELKNLKLKVKKLELELAGKMTKPFQKPTNKKFKGNKKNKA